MLVKVGFLHSNIAPFLHIEPQISDASESEFIEALYPLESKTLHKQDLTTECGSSNTVSTEEMQCELKEMIDGRLCCTGYIECVTHICSLHYSEDLSSIHMSCCYIIMYHKLRCIVYSLSEGSPFDITSAISLAILLSGGS